MAATDQALSFAAPRWPLDKVYYQPDTMSFNVPQSVSPVIPDFYTTTITNPTGELFFIDMQLSPNNSDWYDIGSEPLYYDPTFMLSFSRFSGAWKMDTSTITFFFTALDAAYTPMYYRLVGYSRT